MSSTSSPPAFVVLAPVLLPKVWGGDALARAGLPVQPGERVGEAWLAADLPATAAGGAGGGAVRSPVQGAGGRTLADLIADAPAHWLGEVPPSDDGGFPLLVKLLDAREHLSVQAHPAPAAERERERVKHECWLVLQAEPGAELFLGLRRDVSPAALQQAEGAAIVPLLARVPAVPGECHLLPSGMVHALGAGVVALEVQTPSDTTFRLYDWVEEYGRPPRELHVARAREAWAPDAQAVTRCMPASGTGVLAKTEAFEVAALSVAPARLTVLPRADVAGPRVVVPLDADVELRAGEARLMVPRGIAAVVAAAAADVRVVSDAANRVVVAWPTRPS